MLAMDLGRVFAGVPRVGVVDGCRYCCSQSELDLLGGDPALVPDELVGTFAREVIDHWSEKQYGLMWRGLAPRILGLSTRTLAELPRHACAAPTRTPGLPASRGTGPRTSPAAASRACGGPPRTRPHRSATGSTPTPCTSVCPEWMIGTL